MKKITTIFLFLMIFSIPLYGAVTSDNGESTTDLGEQEAEAGLAKMRAEWKQEREKLLADIVQTHEQTTRDIAKLAGFNVPERQSPHPISMTGEEAQAAMQATSQQFDAHFEKAKTAAQKRQQDVMQQYNNTVERTKKRLDELQREQVSKRSRISGGTILLIAAVGILATYAIGRAFINWLRDDRCKKENGKPKFTNEKKVKFRR